jgi:hypothetical protein
MKPLKLHADLVQFYQEKIPRLPHETNEQLRGRIKANPALLQNVINAAPLSEQIRLLAMRRALAVAGGKRTGGAAAGPNNATTMAPRYVQDVLGRDAASRARFAEEQVKFLEEAFTYDTPTNGSVFWTGVDPDKLVAQVRRWNTEFGSALFGQLEATTDARFINGAFDWSVKDAAVQTTQLYFGAASERYGKGATGHVTSVQMWGLRADSIFATKELPTLLQGMATQLAQRKQPAVTDISIVVLDPKTQNEEYRIFTNLDIGQIAYITKTVADSESRWIRGKQDCGVTGYVSSKIPALVRTYWLDRGRQQPSAAAKRIAQDYRLIKR